MELTCKNRIGDYISEFAHEYKLKSLYKIVDDNNIMGPLFNDLLDEIRLNLYHLPEPKLIPYVNEIIHVLRFPLYKKDMYKLIKDYENNLIEFPLSGALKVQLFDSELKNTSRKKRKIISTKEAVFLILLQFRDGILENLFNYCKDFKLPFNLYYNDDEILILSEIVNEREDNTQKDKLHDISKNLKLKWKGKPSHLALIIDLLIDKGYLEATPYAERTAEILLSFIDIEGFRTDKEVLGKLLHKDNYPINDKTAIDKFYKIPKRAELR